LKRVVREVLLATGCDEDFLPLVTSFVKEAALCHGLGRDEAMGLTLAGEEIFVHLCRTAKPGREPVEIRCGSGGYYVQAEFSFTAEDLDLRAFNLTTSIALDDDAELEGMGLVIASRLVDRFQLSFEQARHVRLSLVQEKSYPLHEEDSPPVCPPLSRVSIRPPSPEEVKLIARQARHCYLGHYLSDFFKYPGKLVDMLAAGEYQGLAAIGPAGEVGGAILWNWAGRRTVECFGPYVFTEDSDSVMAESLVEGCIGAIARTHAVGLINTRPTPQLPEQHFERLGTLKASTEDGASMTVHAWFRLMREDEGCAVWVHEDLQEFVQRECRRLVLPREIRRAQNAGENLPAHSVISVQSDRLQGRAVLRPMWPGSDCEANIEKHVHLMRQEGIPNLFFMMDLGQAWQADFTSGLLHHGFTPCLLLPYAGEADVILLQLSESGS